MCTHVLMYATQNNLPRFQSFSVSRVYDCVIKNFQSFLSETNQNHSHQMVILVSNTNQIRFWLGFAQTHWGAYRLCKRQRLVSETHECRGLGAVERFKSGEARCWAYHFPFPSPYFLSVPSFLYLPAHALLFTQLGGLAQAS